MARLFFVLVSAVLLGAAAPGCGAPPPPVVGDFDLGDLHVEYSGIGGVHSYGSSSCPQPVGSILVTNGGAAAIALDVTESSSQLEIWEVDDLGLTTPWVPRDVAPGETVELVVRFNCSATTDVSTDITVSATPAGGATQSDTIPISLDIQGAP